MAETAFADPYVHDDNLKATFDNNGSGGVSGTITWDGVPGRTYFLKVTAGEELTDSWIYLDLIFPGEGTEISSGFNLSSSNGWFRLAYSDMPIDDPLTADFDGDKIGNWVELQNDTDPLAWVDSDLDGLPDDWEIHYFDGSLAETGSGNSDSDEFTNREEFEFGLDPTEDDREGTAAYVTYTYDYDQLIGASSPVLSIGYEYDPAGNIESVSVQ